MVIVDPPSIFWGMWNMVKALMPLKTQQKVGNRPEGRYAAGEPCRDDKSDALMLRVMSCIPTFEQSSTAQCSMHPIAQ